MYRYQGNTGRYVWVPDGPAQSPAGPGRQPMRQGPRREPQRPPPAPGPMLPDVGSGISGLLSKVFPDGFEMEDALLLLVLFLMYRETGDQEFLMIMGAMFLM